MTEQDFIYRIVDLVTTIPEPWLTLAKFAGRSFCRWLLSTLWSRLPDWRSVFRRLQHRAVPMPRLWQRRLGLVLRSALRAMPPKLSWPALPPAESR